LFGGGYQLLYLENGRFTMLPSATYLFMFALEDGDVVQFGRASRLLKVAYEYQIFHTMAVTHVAGAPLGSAEVHWTPQIMEDIGYFPPPSLPVESIYYCIWVDVL